MTPAEDSIQAVKIAAGPLKAEFHPNTLFLRHVTQDGAEVLRGIYAALRDKNWGTIKPKITGVTCSEEGDASNVRCQVKWDQGDIQFVATCEISGTAEGTIRYAFTGESHHPFLKNRLGLVVLHAAGLAGAPLRCQHTDGGVEEGAFPSMISPHQPLKDIRAIWHPLPTGGELKVTMEGDTFEMEDQRNWTDASFKTYCTPLEKPFPVELTKGEKVGQCVTISIEGQSGRSHAGNKDTPFITENNNAPDYKFPKIGFSIPSETEIPSSPGEMELFSRLAPDHLRLDLEKAESTNATAWLNALYLAKLLHLPLEIAVSEPATFDKRGKPIIERIIGEGIAIARILLAPVLSGDPSDSTLKRTRAWLQDLGINAPLIVGTDGNFAELNRTRPSSQFIDGVCYPINPQVHAFDDESLIETLEVQPKTASDAKRIASGKQVIISPVTLRPRNNPAATVPPPSKSAESAETCADPRQRLPFGFAWTCGSLLQLAASPADSITYFQTHGPRGIIDTGTGQMELKPLYYAFQQLAQFKESRIQKLDSSVPLRCGGAKLFLKDRVSYFLVNFTAVRETVRMDIPALGSALPVQQIDFPAGDLHPQTHTGILRGDKVELPPYSITRIDS